ncbi:MAG: 50S ribosomal protein L13 [Anaerolineae bacterium]|nr:50S ribosomal protein L13 [Anaerolineae bacterium]
MKTYTAKPEDIQREWYVVDATDKTLGRLASQIASVLRGKHKTIFSPHLDTGDFVIVINAEKIRVTGNRLDDKYYHKHSRYPGGLRSIKLRHMLVREPEFPLHEAVRRMIPKGPLGFQVIRKLKIYAGPEHPHQAQNPRPFPFAE